MSPMRRRASAAGKGWRPGQSSWKTTRSWNSRPAQITTINGNLTLNGASAHVADAGTTTSNSALTGLTSVTDIFRLENGAKVATTGNLSITGNAIVSLDGPDLIFGGGGTSLTIGGKLTNNSTNGNGLDVGNTGLVSADTLTVNGTGGLINGATSEINIEGSASVRATLNVANAAAGFGSGKGVETGTVFLENDALLEFKTGSDHDDQWRTYARRRKRPRRRRRRDHQQQRADRPEKRYRQFLSGKRREGRDDRQFEHHRQRAL